MEPGAEPRADHDGNDQPDVTGEPSERERAVRASSLGVALGSILALLGHHRRDQPLK